MKIQYQITFHSFWHSSSGLSGGVYADSLVIKDDQNIPYLPGRTVKGLLRDSAYRVKYFSEGALVTDDFIYRVFGERPNSTQQVNEVKTLEAEAFFGNAHVSSFVKAELQKTPELINQLYDIHASTKINEKGVAEDHSLRQMEIVVPLTLYGQIDHFPESEVFEKQLHYCMQGVKRLGLNRTRGLGRCTFSIINKTA